MNSWPAHSGYLFSPFGSPMIFIGARVGFDADIVSRRLAAAQIAHRPVFVSVGKGDRM
jgi:hypothetical protein